MIIVAIILGIFLIIQLFSWISIKIYQPRDIDPIRHYPKVSILLAARNEELLIGRCLDAMDQLTYPKDKLEIIIGDDDSTDNTLSIVRDFIKNKSNFQVHSIQNIIGKGRGKANVLGQLAHQATGEFLFITDVDVKLPPTWIQALLQEFEEGIGLVSGTTMCESGNLFATMQSIDWLHFMGYIKAFAHVGVGCTSVGNNMAVRAEAYWQTGGYEVIDFSITEDYKLFQAVTKLGWGWKNILSKYSLGKAWFIPSFVDMLHQRKRWLIGAKDLPLNWKTMIIIYGLFIPAFGYVMLFYPIYALGIWLLKFFMQSLFILLLCDKTGVRRFTLVELISYEIYVMLNTFSTAIFYYLPIKSIWKDRIYGASYIEDGVQ